MSEKEVKKQSKRASEREPKRGRESRIKRMTLRRKGPLHVREKQPGMKYRWVNDDLNNVEDRLDQGFDFVVDKSGKKVTKKVGHGVHSEITAYLMAAPESVIEDIKALQAEEAKEQARFIDEHLDKDYGGKGVEGSIERSVN